MTKPVVFDAADYLDSEAVIAEYLNVALSSEDPDLFLQAIADVAKARGMAQVAKETGLGRESLYKALAPGAKPRWEFRPSSAACLRAMTYSRSGWT